MAIRISDALLQDEESGFLDPRSDLRRGRVVVIRAFQGVLTGAVVWLGFVATVTLTFSIFEGPPLKVWLLFAGYQLVIFAVEGGVFAVW